MILVRDVAKKRGKRFGDPSLVYLDLWSRCFDEGVVVIRDEAECAFAAGYTGTRATRSWNERVHVLQELGFIETKRAHNREFAQILILNPIQVAARLHEEGEVDEAWWNAFLSRAEEIGAVIPMVGESE